MFLCVWECWFDKEFEIYHQRPNFVSIKNIDWVYLNPSDARLDAITQIKIPENRKDVQSLLGNVNHLKSWLPEILFTTTKYSKWHKSWPRILRNYIRYQCRQEIKIHDGRIRIKEIGRWTKKPVNLRCGGWKTDH